uniref:VP2 n=1 Tax=Wenling sharpspine skate calicivirus TaxID=2116393 RepID=A0A2P1GN38_9CALI|nr:VP2 [Wenling sharpspine skate calicivirus]
MAGAAIAAGVLDGILGGAAQIGAAATAAKINQHTTFGVTNRNLAFNQSVINQREKAYTDSGLPSYLAWSGSSGRINPDFVQPGSTVSTYIGGGSSYMRHQYQTYGEQAGRYSSRIGGSSALSNSRPIGSNRTIGSNEPNYGIEMKRIQNRPLHFVPGNGKLNYNKYSESYA